MADGSLEFLGEIDQKKYFLDLRTEILGKDGKTKVQNPTYGQLVWKIPDTRESIHAQPGMKILSNDYSQVEVRIMAWLSQDPGLIKAINSGQDIHCYFAVDIYGAELGFDYPTINKARKDDKHPRHEELSFIRSGVKTTVFGTPYGASPAKIAQMTGMTEEQAAEFQARYFAKYPRLKIWLDTEGSNALRYGFSTSPRGRKRFYILPNRNDPEREKIIAQIKRWAGNFPIQSGNVDMLKPAMARIYKAFRARGWTYEQARILFVVHDEIVCTCLDELVPEVQWIMAEAMHWAFNQVIPVDKMLSGMEQKDAGNILMGTIDQNVVQVDTIWKKD